MNIEGIGHTIRERRKSLGINQTDAAELAEISVHTLSNIETGSGNPTIEVLLRVLQVLGLKLSIEAGHE